MSASLSAPDPRLGLTLAEWQIVVHQQQIALQGSHNGSMVSRGRGMGRSTSSSRAASAASSQGRLLLDPGSIQALHHQLDYLMRDIQNRIEDLNEQAERSMQNTHDRVARTVADADAEMARVRRIIDTIDELEMEFEKIKRIRDIVKGQRARVETLHPRLDQASRRRR